MDAKLTLSPCLGLPRVSLAQPHEGRARTKLPCCPRRTATCYPVLGLLPQEESL